MTNLRSLSSSLSLLALAVLLLTACEKQITNETKSSDVEMQKAVGFATVGVEINGAELNGVGDPGVMAGQSFPIAVSFWCGRVALSRGYVLAEDGVTRIYKDISCESADIQWETVSGFNCNTAGFTVDQTLPEAGTYVYRTQHQPTSPNNSACGKSKCDGIKGVQTFCFTVTAN